MQNLTGDITPFVKTKMDLIETINSLMDNLFDEWKMKKDTMREEQMRELVCNVQRSIIIAAIGHSSADITNVLTSMRGVSIDLLDDA